MNPLKNWPKSERPREKLLSAGAESLSDAELLALFLRQGTRNLTVVDLARNLLAKYSGFRPLFDADIRELNQYPGLGPAKIAVIKAVVELSRRYYNEQLIRHGCLTNPNETKQYLRAQLRNCQRETFACLFLDNRNQVIQFEKMFQGTINQASVYPREIAKRALYHNACAVIFAHNHPSGYAQASQSDLLLTEKLVECLAVLEINVLDHLIIADNKTVSFAELGYLKKL